MDYTQYFPKVKDLERWRYRPGSNQDYAIGYFGTQTRYSSYVTTFYEPNKYPLYFDLTCGGHGIPYKLARKGQRIAVNDRNKYVVACARSVFESDVIPGNRIEYVLERLREVEPHAGLLTAKVVAGGPVVRASGFRQEMAEFIDGCAKHFQGDPLFIAGLGKMLSNSTFRSLGWANTDAMKVPIKDWTWEFWFDKLCRNTLAFADRRAEMAELSTGHQVFDGDALQAVKSVSDLRGAYVYIDPAWPWHPKYGTQENPYKFLAGDLVEVLVQGPPPDIQYWPMDNPQPIVDDVLSWITAAFERDAAVFVVSTQSTNFPDPTLVFDAIRERFGSNRVTIAENQEIRGTLARFEEFLCRVAA